MSRPASAFPSPSASASSPSSPGGIQRTPAQFEPSSVQLATELADFFRLVAPHRLQDVPRLVRAFAAQPEALIASLQAEYREELEAVRNQAADQDPHLVPASNNKDQYVMRVLSMYQTYAPHKLKPNGNPPIVPADVILARYAGDEPALLAALTVKYGPEPEFSYRWFSDAGTMPPPSPQRTAAPSVADLALRDGPNPIRVQRLVQSMMQNHHGSLAQLMSGLIERFGPEPVATDPVSKYSWEARLERFVKHYWDDIVITSQSTPGSPRSLASGASSPRPGMVADDAADAAMLASLGRGTAPVQHRMEWAAVEDLDLTDPFPGLRIEGAPRPGGHAASPSRRDVLLSHVPVLPLTMTNADLALLPSLRGELGAAPTVYWLSRVLLWDTAMTAAPVWRTVVLTDSALLIATAEDIVDCILPLPGPDNCDSPRQLSMEVTVFMPPQAAPKNSVDPTLTGALPVNAYGLGSDDDVCVVTLQARPSRASRYFEAKKSAHVRAFERHAAPMSTAEVIVRKAQDAGVDALRNITLVFPGMYLGARQATVTNDQHRPPLQRATGRSQGPRFVTVLSRVIARNDPSCTLGKRLHARITPPPAYVAEVHPRLGMRLEHPLLAQHVRGAIAAAKGSDPDL